MKDIYRRIINKAIDKKASDIHILIKDQCNIFLRKDGNLVKFDELPIAEGKKLINYLRFISDIDINFLLKPQTGHINYDYLNKIYYLRVSSLPGLNVDSIVIRILNNKDDLDINDLSIFNDTRDFLKKVINYSSGLFIVSGPTGSGKSTTLYTLLDIINKQTKRNIVTIEDPIEIKKDYCLQVQLNNELGINYQNTLKQILRHDPDIIMIGEIRDFETAKLAINAALTGHLVLTTIHASTCITSIKRLLNLGINKIDLEDTLVGLLSQRLIYQKHQPLVLSEIINKKEIHNYFNNLEVNFHGFDYKIRQLYDEKIISEKEYEYLLNE